LGGQAAAVGLQNATATFSQPVFGGGPWLASQMIDGNTGGFNGWAVYDPSQPAATATSAQIAAFEMVTDLSAPAIRVNMLHLHGSANGHNVGRFRFSVTQDDRSTFCDGLQTGGDVTANWTVLTPGSIVLPTGMTSTVLGDESILIGGTTQNGSYVVTFDLPFGGVTGLRLEVMDDPSLPFNGPGRHSANGNFVLTELYVAALPCVPDVTAGAVAGGEGYGQANGIVNNDDFFYFLAQFAAGNLAVCDLTAGAVPGQPGYGVPNGVLNNDDFFYFLAKFAAGC
jgi:hypothetical protein